jgi:peptidyl-prolyl cis-trans isomerase SurA
MVDNIVFGASPVKPANSAFDTYFMYDFVVINEPEEVDDVKGQVTGDYQNLLEQEWIEELKVKYPVVINEKELKKIK